MPRAVPAILHFLHSSSLFPSMSFFDPLFKTKATILTKNFSPQVMFVRVRCVSRVSGYGLRWKSTCFIGC
ncbi:hypothetical protein V8E53_009132, partial [Lactarius tabidus]